MKKNPKTFISYSHDNDVHRRTVLAFADQLRKQGIINPHYRSICGIIMA